jgi:molybdopterin molybdotransferase
MKSLDHALDQLLGIVPRPEQGVRVPLESALGRVLARDISSPLDVPAYDNSQMDGYAGRVVDMNNALEPLLVSQRIPAGHPGCSLQEGTVARIFTGAPIPDGANAVVMQEQVTVLDDGRIRLTAPVEPGQNIRPRAGDLSRGQIILHAGRRLAPADLGLCASVGLQGVDVWPRLRVAVFSSGDELRQPGESLGSGQIYDSNRPMIIGMAAALGAEVIDMGCLPDRLEATRLGLAAAAEAADLILTCGGVSVGEEDHIKAAIRSLGSLDLWRIAIKPGKPFACGRIGSAVFMGMPGNPVAAWVTFSLLVRPAILRASGASLTRPRAWSVPAAFDWPRPDARQEFLRGWIDDSGCARIHQRQNSSVLSSVTECGGLIEVSPSTPVRPGEFVRFIPYTELS